MGSRPKEGRWAPRLHPCRGMWHPLPFLSYGRKGGADKFENGYIGVREWLLNVYDVHITFSG